MCLGIGRLVVDRPDKYFTVVGERVNFRGMLAFGDFYVNIVTVTVDEVALEHAVQMSGNSGISVSAANDHVCAVNFYAEIIEAHIVSVPAPEVNILANEIIEVFFNIGNLGIAADFCFVNAFDSDLVARHLLFIDTFDEAFACQIIGIDVESNLTALASDVIFAKQAFVSMSDNEVAIVVACLCVY